MTNKEMSALTQETHQLLHTLRAEVIQRSLDIGLNLHQARKIWLYSVQSESRYMAEYWSIRSIPISFAGLKDQINGK